MPFFSFILIIPLTRVILGLWFQIWLNFGCILYKRPLKLRKLRLHQMLNNTIFEFFQ